MQISKKDKLVVFGEGPFAEIAYEYFTYDSIFEVVAFTAERDYIRKDSFCGKPVVEFEKLEQDYPPQEFKIFIALTYGKLNRLRTRIYKESKRKGYTIPSYISSKAFFWHNAEIGENCFIFEDNTIQPFVKIGNNVIVWSGNHIGHHSIIKDNCFISSHVVISGFCEIGENCFFGVNSTLANNIVIAKDCVIGAGALVIHNTEERKTYIINKKEGVPFNVGVLNYFKLESVEELNELDKKIDGIK